MKTLHIIAVFILILFTACNKDDKNDMSHLIEGHWHVFDFQSDAGTSADDSLQAREAILASTSNGCDAIEYTFNAEGKVFGSDGLQYLSMTTGDAGDEFNCPSQFDQSRGTFSFDNKQLILDYEQGRQLLDASMEGDYLTAKVVNILIAGKRVSGKLFFKIEENE